MNFELSTILVLSIVSFATLLRSTFGFADAMFAMPLLAVLIGLKTATPLMAIIAMTISTAILLKNWRDVQLKSAWRLFVSSLAGIPLGLWFLKGTHDNLMKFIFSPGHHRRLYLQPDQTPSDRHSRVKTQPTYSALLPAC